MRRGEHQTLVVPVKKISTFAVNDPENRPTSDSTGRPGREIKRNSNKSKSTTLPGPAALRAGLNQTLFVLANYSSCFVHSPDSRGNVSGWKVDLNAIWEIPTKETQPLRSELLN